MKKVTLLGFCMIFTVSLCLYNVSAKESQVEITNLKELALFITNRTASKGIVSHDIYVDDTANSFGVPIAAINKDINMNGHSIIVEENQMFCIKSKLENKTIHFYTHSDKPIFRVEGGLELYAGQLSSTGTGHLIEIGSHGKLYTKQALRERTFYSNEKGIDIGMHTIYDNQKVEMRIPQGTAIYGGSEEAYYHMDIQAKVVVDSSIKPTFYYSTIQSPQNMSLKQGVYNGVKNMRDISIWEHQLVVGIGDEIDVNSNDNSKEEISDAVPTYIVTKDNQHITVSFDTSHFNPLLDEQILTGQYHNVDSFYLDYLPKLELKVLKNQEVPLSQLSVYYEDSLTNFFYSRWINLYVIANYVNYTDDQEILFEYAYNKEFKSSQIDDGMFYGMGVSTHISGSGFGMKKGETLYIRLNIKKGLQVGYSNVLKVSANGMEYVQEPDSQWKTQDKEDSFLPPPSLGEGSTEKPDDRNPEGNDHRNDGSIDEPNNKKEEVIDKESINDNIEADKDIVVELEKNKVVLPLEVIKKYKSHDITISELDNHVFIKAKTDNNEISINDTSIEIIRKKASKSSYSGYIFVGITCGACVIAFLWYQRRVR